MKVLVVDDHELIRRALPHVLRVLDADVEVLEAADTPEGLSLASAHPDTDLVLLDLGLPGKTGLEALHEFREQHPALPIVVLSASEDPNVVLRAIDSGAMGFIPKASKNNVLINALRLVLSGAVYLPDVVCQSASRPADREASEGTVLSCKDLGLTPRQSEVLSLLIQGKPNKLICRELGLAEGTVKIHVTAILRALGVLNRTQAVIAVSTLGLKLRPLGKATSLAGSR